MRFHTLVYLVLLLMLAACQPTPAATALPAASPSPGVTATDPQSSTGQPAEKTRQPAITANVMHWETAGGGQIVFSVTRNGQAYDVVVTAYQAEARQDRFTITAEAGPVYETLSKVMQDQGSIGSYAPGGPPRGSWTTLAFSDGMDSSTYRDVILGSDLRIIYDYVAAQIELK